MLITFHIALAYITVVGFVMRGLYSICELDSERWMKIAPHVVDTLLLTLGITMAVNLQIPLHEGWLAAKLAALLSYIFFGVVTLRAKYKPVKLLAFAFALGSVVYLIIVAMTRQAWPF